LFQTSAVTAEAARGPRGDSAEAVPGPAAFQAARAGIGGGVRQLPITQSLIFS
jgi:hypothetical protein